MVPTHDQKYKHVIEYHVMCMIDVHTCIIFSFLGPNGFLQVDSMRISFNLRYEKNTKQRVALTRYRFHFSSGSKLSDTIHELAMQL